MSHHASKPKKRPTIFSDFPQFAFSRVLRILFVLAFSLLTLLPLKTSAADNREPGQRLSKRCGRDKEEDVKQQADAMLASQQVQAGDEIWLVSSRSIANCSADVAGLCWYQLANGCLEPRTFADFQAAHESEPLTRSLFYAHGNNTNAAAAIVGGLTVYQNLFLQRNETTRVRHVIWSWPSEKEIFPIGKDADLKSRRAVSEGVTMRSVLDQLNGPRPILLGYSFGGQVVVSALQSPTENSNSEPYCVTLIAPGLNRDFIHCELDREMLAVNTMQMNAFVNRKDKVIWANNRNYCRRKYRGSGMCDHRISSKVGTPDYLSEFELGSDGCAKHSIALYSQNSNVVAGIRRQLECCGVEPELGDWIEAPLSGELMSD